MTSPCRASDAGGDDVLARCTGTMHGDRIAVPLGVFHHHDCIGALGNGSAGHDLDSLSRLRS